jgi:ribosomal protein S18 acetylase RimI-like enzyme
MTNVPSIEFIGSFFNSIKERGAGLLTNFFLDIPKTGLWLSKGSVKYEKIGDTFFIFRQNDGFLNLYFISPGPESIERDLETLRLTHAREFFVVDLVGQQDAISIRDIFLNNGFNEYIALVRMSMISAGDPGETTADACMSYADKGVCPEILSYFDSYFDPLCEQVPYIEELTDWADRKRMIIYSSDKTVIQGFLIFEHTGKTAYLRYWFVHPEHRDKKIGSALIKKFFSETASATRRLFWVIETNGNAIKRYEHYGFKKESLYDRVLINRNQSYEGKDN